MAQFCHWLHYPLVPTCSQLLSALLHRLEPLRFVPVAIRKFPHMPRKPGLGMCGSHPILCVLSAPPPVQARGEKFKTISRTAAESRRPGDHRQVVKRESQTERELLRGAAQAGASRLGFKSDHRYIRRREGGREGDFN